METRGLTPTDLAYIAGYVDGEGCFRLSGTAPRFSLNNTYLPTLLWMKAHFGGSLRSIKKVAPHHRQAYEWELGVRSGIHSFIEDIYPYLREKAQQAELVLECMELPRGDLRKVDIADELKAIKREEYYFEHI